MTPQRWGVRQIPCYIFKSFTILFYDVSKTSYKNFGGLGCAQFFAGHRKVDRVDNLYEKVNFVIQTCAIGHYANPYPLF